MFFFYLAQKVSGGDPMDHPQQNIVITHPLFAPRNRFL